MSLRTVPVTFADARRFLGDWRRHHRSPVGHKFSIGVAIVGQPVARALDDGLSLHVIRVAPDGHRNANSLLYAASWRAAEALGYRRLISYTSQTESGASLRAAGWQLIASLPPRRGWTTPSRPRAGHGVDDAARHGWHAP